MIFLFNQKLRQCYTDVKRGSTIRVAILKTFLFSLLVTETFVGFGDHDELSTGFRVIRIAIGMVNECEFPISFFDLLNRRVRINF